MADNYVETAFTISVTRDEAELLKECCEVADEISFDFPTIQLDGNEAAKAYYAKRSEAFRTTFPEQGNEEDPFAAFLELWSHPDYPSFDADMTISKSPDGDGQEAYFCGVQVDTDALASLIQRVCKSALPFGFEWANYCSKPRSGEFGGGYLVITDTDIIGGSTHWLMQETLNSLRKGPD